MTDVILIAGLWLPAEEWNGVVAELAALGHRGVPVRLPGQDDGNLEATLDDQLAAVLAALDAADVAQGKPLIVGHSAACSLAWMAAAARPGAVSGVALIGGFPMADGSSYADFFETANGVMPFPGWAPFTDDGSAADLDAAARDRLAGAMVPVPEGVSRAVVRLAGQGRYSIPVTVVCPEFSPEQAREWIEAGDVPELAQAQHLTFADLDSSHWPMVTKPRELAALLAGFADVA